MSRLPRFAAPEAANAADGANARELNVYAAGATKEVVIRMAP
jgi:hypothetical protein